MCSLSVCLSVFVFAKMVCKTNTQAVLYGALALATGVDCLRTSFTVSELGSIAAGEASLQEQYSGVRAAVAVAADTNPSLLYPAHNLSVPVDHFHNDSLYEPHVSCNHPDSDTGALQVADWGPRRPMTPSI